MADYYNPDDPWRRDAAYDLNARRRSSAWSWIAGALFLAIVLGIAFDAGQRPNSAGNNMVAGNGGTLPMTQPRPTPSGPASSAYSPITPTNPAPANPAQRQAKP